MFEKQQFPAHFIHEPFIILFLRPTFAAPQKTSNSDYIELLVWPKWTFLPAEFGSVGIKIGVWTNSGGLNNLGRPSFGLGSAPEKLGVWTAP